MAIERDLGAVVGPQGPKGDPGEKGDKGDKGDQGPAGENAPSLCDQLLTNRSQTTWSAVTLTKSLTNYKYLTVVITFDGETVGLMNIPVIFLQKKNTRASCIRVSCPADFGEMSACLYYVSSTRVMIQTSSVGIELYGVS